MVRVPGGLAKRARAIACGPDRGHLVPSRCRLPVLCPACVVCFRVYDARRVRALSCFCGTRHADDGMADSCGNAVHIGRWTVSCRDGEKTALCQGGVPLGRGECMPPTHLGARRPSATLTRTVSVLAFVLVAIACRAWRAFARRALARPVTLTGTVGLLNRLLSNK